MSKTRSDALFTLIKSMTKSEKRYFKLSQNGGDGAKYLRLFGHIDAGRDFDESRILSLEPDFDPARFSSLKAHLYGRVLKSLRDYALKSVPEMEVRAMIDEAEVLLRKGLYAQCRKHLDKAEKRAEAVEGFELILEILRRRKQLLAYTAGFEKGDYVGDIVEKTERAARRINNINSFTNLQAELGALYRKSGYIRNADEHVRIRKIFKARVPEVRTGELSVRECIHLYRLYIGYHFFAQEFAEGLAYAKKWTDLFAGRKDLQRSNAEDYIAGINNLLIAQNKCGLTADFAESKRTLRRYSRSAGPGLNPHLGLKLRKYTVVHAFNGLFMNGDFDRGVALFERLAPGLDGFLQQLDPHSRVILHYKSACLYFANGDYGKCIARLHRIFNTKEADLREDIHAFARILHLIAHYEAGHTDALPYHLRSTYRFLLQKQELRAYQKLLLNFMRRLGADSGSLRKGELHSHEPESPAPGAVANGAPALSHFRDLRAAMLRLRENPYEARAFVYFDIIAWLDTHLEGKTMQEVVQGRVALTR